MGPFRERAGGPSRYIDDSEDEQASDCSEGGSPRQLSVERGPSGKRQALAGNKRSNSEVGELQGRRRRR